MAASPSARIGGRFFIFEERTPFILKKNASYFLKGGNPQAALRIRGRGSVLFLWGSVLFLFGRATLFPIQKRKSVFFIFGKGKKRGGGG